MPSQQPRPEGKGFFWHASVFKKALGWNTNQCFAHSRHSRSDDEIEPKLVKDVLLRVVVLCTSHKILASDYCSSLQSSKLCYLVAFGYSCFVVLKLKSK